MINGSIFHLPLADKSVHCVVFSPPYYGLRDYQLDPIIIGGELDCVHEWGSEQLIKQQSNWHTLDDYIIGAHGNVGSGKQNAGKSGTHGSFCLNCSAWRGSLGLEPTPELFIEHCRIYAKECWRVLRDDGTMWVNIGASYAGSGKGGNPDKSPHQKQATNKGSLTGSSPILNNYKAKDLVPTPWLFAIALQQDGWYLRSDIIWQKPNPMPESVTDRPTRSHEYVFLFSKSRRYFYDADAVRENVSGTAHKRQKKDGSSPSLNFKMGVVGSGNRNNPSFQSYMKDLPAAAGRNLRSVWEINTHGFSEAHFATFPPRLIEPMIKAGTSEGGVCVECGGQFERVVDRLTATPGQPVGYIQNTRMRNDGDRAGHWINQSSHTLGFRPTCNHYDHLPHDRTDPDWTAPLNWLTEKATVLDPFGGAGTTELVAVRLGRCGVSIELSREYCRMGSDRIADDMPPMLELIERKREPRQVPLFAPDNGKIETPD